ncbi:MAG: UDP-glucose/GDP-mannose dehydrogenase family protein, partial [Candidatus Melainabacteria bacterium]|nr:UDP-glucose/GDP-mannose dehydrogenase family protein [Candidatus Melainabacteria bacterium]
MNVAVVGAGYVGLVTSVCLAYFGNKVVAIDTDTARVAKLKQGEVPFYEPYLSQFVQQCVAAGALEFTFDLNSAVKHSEVVFIAVGTPAKEDGEPDMSAVAAVARAIGGALDSAKTRLIVNKSTVPVGSGNWVEMLVEQGVQAVTKVPAGCVRPDAPAFAVVSNPEFLREGTAIADSLYPDRIVVGCPDNSVAERMKELYKPVVTQSFKPPDFAPRPQSLTTVPFLVTDLASAEMIKYSANAFLAMKISFANEMSVLCEKVGADVRQVAQGIGLDKRIGSSFLNAGIGWGVSCF